MFAASGAAGLVYQIVWARWLGLVFGNTTTSVTIVLTAFMAGLAAGSAAAGVLLRRERARSPMLAYAVLELAIGTYAAAFPFLTAGLDVAFRSISDSSAGGIGLLASRIALAFLVLLPPTTLMGATLPLVTEHVRAEGRFRRAWSVGVLYAVNTMGAAAGALAASFVLIEILGVRDTTRVAVVLNLLAALLGYRLHAGRAGHGTSEPRQAVPAASARTTARASLWLLALGGGFALASEILWTRALSIAVGKSTYVFAVILVVYLLGIALGSWAAALVVKGLQTPMLWLASAQAAMGAWTVAALWLRDLVSASLAGQPPQPLGPLRLLVECALAASLLLPLALASGASFPVATRLLDPVDEAAAGTPVARAYAWNTSGAILGSLAGGFLIAPRTDLFHAISLLAALYGATAAGVALFALCRPWEALPRRGAWVLLATAAGVVAIAARGLWPDRSLTARLERGAPGYTVAFYRTGLQGTTAVLLPDDPTTAPSRGGRLLVNGSGMTVQAVVTKMMAHLPLFIHPRPERVLVICFGMGTTYRSALAHGADVTAVELVEEVPEAFGLFFHDAAAVRANPRGRIVIDDGRSFLSLSRESWDVITIDPPPPIDGAGVNHLYARDFYLDARAHLREGGIMAQFIPLPGSRAGVNDEETFQMLARTFASVFPHVATIRNGRLGAHFLGAMAPFRADPDRVRRLYGDPKLRADLVEWGTIDASSFTEIASREVPPEEGKPIVTDDRPLLEFDLWRSLRLGSRKDRGERW